MLFATNRTPKQSIRSKKNRKISFSNQNTTASEHMYFCYRNGVDDYIEIKHQAFFETLKDNPQKQILLYIHGFNNTPEKEIFPNAIKLQQLIDQTKGEDFATVIPLIWPCDDDNVIAFIDDYWDDQRAADASGLAFSRMLGKFDHWRERQNNSDSPCTKRINILAHSMGNRVLRNAINAWGKYDHGKQIPQLFRNVFMMAADVSNHCLEPSQSAELIPHSCRNLIVYYANDDLAMPASKLANLKNKTISRRLGMTGVENIENVPRNVYEVDCDNFNNRFDKPKGHTYFLADEHNTISPALIHMLSAMDGGRVKPSNKQIILE